MTSKKNYMGLDNNFRKSFNHYTFLFIKTN